MKITFVGKCNSIMLHNDNSFSSCVAWTPSDSYSEKSVYLKTKLELGQRVDITFDTEPEIQDEDITVTDSPSTGVSR
jgi:hypothetical protein